MNFLAHLKHIMNSSYVALLPLNNFMIKISFVAEIFVVPYFHFLNQDLQPDKYYNLDKVPPDKDQTARWGIDRCGCGCGTDTKTPLLIIFLKVISM